MPTIEIHIRPILDRHELTRAMDAHSEVKPENAAELARWWYRSGELWASLATIERRPNLSTLHAFSVAKEKYALAGDLEMVKSCEDTIAAEAAWHDSEAKRASK